MSARRALLKKMKTKVAFFAPHEAQPMLCVEASECIYPLVNLYITMDNHHISWQSSQFKWLFPIGNC